LQTDAKSIDPPPPSNAWQQKIRALNHNLGTDPCGRNQKLTSLCIFIFSMEKSLTPHMINAEISMYNVQTNAKGISNPSPPPPPPKPWKKKIPALKQPF